MRMINVFIFFFEQRESPQPHHKHGTGVPLVDIVCEKWLAG
jgi:hypothetical protein